MGPPPIDPAAAEQLRAAWAAAAAARQAVWAAWAGAAANLLVAVIAVGYPWWMARRERRSGLRTVASGMAHTLRMVTATFESYRKNPDKAVELGVLSGMLAAAAQSLDRGLARQIEDEALYVLAQRMQGVLHHAKARIDDLQAGMQIYDGRRFLDANRDIEQLFEAFAEQLAALRRRF